ncbi:unnamed protein product [Calypogeia fissa]
MNIFYMGRGFWKLALESKTLSLIYVLKPHQMKAMFIRVKRKKTTYFLHCDPTETVLEIKQKIQALSDNPVDCQRLILLSSQLVLEDNRTLADQKVVEGLQGVLLGDAKTLADQQVENDVIGAEDWSYLCVGPVDKQALQDYVETMTSI